VPALPDERWVRLLGDDPRPWLLAAGEPPARWAALTELLAVPPGAPEAREARAASLASAEVALLRDRLPAWESEPITSHNRDFAPHLLRLLYQMGIRAGDDPRVDSLLDAMLRHQDEDARFCSLGAHRATDGVPQWGALLCDHNAIVEALLLYDRTDDPRTRRGVERLTTDLAETAQGPGWPCVPHSPTGWRGPGRKGDVCPEVTLEALRACSYLPEAERPPAVLEAARTILGCWRRRGLEQPYMFGHGRRFKTVKWPPFWYDVHAVLETLGRYPELWRGPAADPEDRQSLAELAACLVAYNGGPDGVVTPRSCYQGFGDLSFGQKKLPSAFATARVCAVLRRFDDLAGEIAGVDVLALGSSKGGSGTALAPAGGR